MKKKLPIRSQYIASPGKVLLAFDFSQAESWVVSRLADCKAMKAALDRAGTKFDIHYTSARGLYSYSDAITPSYDERYMGKKFNHACSYGMSYLMVAHTINSEAIYPPYLTVSNPEAKDKYNKWIGLYHEIPRWWLDTQRLLETHNRVLRTPYGRERQFHNRWGNDLFKEAYAYVPQSTVGDHCLGHIHPELGIRGGVRAIYYDIAKPSGGDINILNTSHDSVILEAPTVVRDEVLQHAFRLLKRPLVVNGEEFTIPVDAEIGHAWGELEKVEIS